VTGAPQKFACHKAIGDTKGRWFGNSCHARQFGQRDRRSGGHRLDERQGAAHHRVVVDTKPACCHITSNPGWDLRHFDSEASKEQCDRQAGGNAQFVGNNRGRTLSVKVLGSRCKQRFSLTAGMRFIE
jgi:hypothetical protein